MDTLVSGLPGALSVSLETEVPALPHPVPITWAYREP